MVNAIARYLRQQIRLDPKVRVDLSEPLLHLGSIYGGWSVLPTRLSSDSVVLSVGIGTDLSFDLALIEKFGCRVHAYDPTPRSLVWLAEQSLPHQLSVYPVGLADRDGIIEVEEPVSAEHVSFHINRGLEHPGISIPVRCLAGLLAELGVSSCDLLKMDIEGAEYGVCADIIANGPRPRQLLVEFHHRLYGFTVAMTEASIALLRKAGYRVYWVSATGREYGLALD